MLMLLQFRCAFPILLATRIVSDVCNHPDRQSLKKLITFMQGFFMFQILYIVDHNNGETIHETLVDLHPYNNYTISVRCKPVHGGYWSEPTTGSITTEQAGRLCLI